MPELTRDDFTIGMPVVCIESYPDGNTQIKKGDTGVVASIASGSKPIGVQWDHNCGGHNLRGVCQNGRGWWCPIKAIMPIDDAVLDEQYIDEADFASLDELYGG